MTCLNLKHSCDVYKVHTRIVNKFSNSKEIINLNDYKISIIGKCFDEEKKRFFLICNLFSWINQDFLFLHTSQQIEKHMYWVGVLN